MMAKKGQLKKDPIKNLLMKITLNKTQKIRNLNETMGD